MKNEQHTLVILTPGFPKDEADSTCLPSQQNFIRAVNINFPGIQIIILSFQYPFASTIYNWHGNRVIVFNGRNRGNFFRRLLWARVKKQLKTIYSENKIVGLLSFWCGECAFIAGGFAKQYNLKHFCWILGQDAKMKNKYVHRVHADGFISLSDFIQEEFYKNYGIYARHIIPLGIDVNEFALAEKQRDIDILAVGSLIPLKQYGVFLHITAALKKFFPAIKATLCGGGPEYEKLRLLLKQLSLQGNIVLTGETPHAEILDTMQRSRIFLHTSNYEGFGLVCLEALYAGCSVISFVQPMKENIEHWYVVKNKEEMLQQCMELLQNKAYNFKRVLPYQINDTALAVMKLFGCD